MSAPVLVCCQSLEAVERHQSDSYCATKLTEVADGGGRGGKDFPTPKVLFTFRQYCSGLPVTL